ncbi:MAG: Formate hydrogenlyase transcriptional activator [Syntrophorhabdus sp. PtaU1.Bin050]|nr:MAG: Formate hydrogenlyase transcriptional activator [Syntrophorhabdus sp. PtaU1.Bin050]
MDHNEFFREMTTRLCGTLEIERALSECLQYAQKIIPLDQIQMSFYDPREANYLFVGITGIKGERLLMANDTELPPLLRKELEEVDKWPPSRIANYPDPSDAFCHYIGLSQNWEECSVLINRMVLDRKYIGSFVARAFGKNRYTDEHLRLWALIYEPAAIVLTNTKRYREVIRLKDDKSYLQNELRKNYGERLVGAESGLRRVMEKVRMVAPMMSPVLLTGETGTGKEVIANAIHDISYRSKGSFIKMNCGAIPETLIDSELFGHEKGAFTGALNQKRGRFEMAHGGTIFLDEVSELPPQAQVRLLRVLQEKEFERVGGTMSIKIDVRILSASNQPLEDLVLKGQFREDLYFRLNVFPIVIPPLRERKSDIIPLVDHFINKKSREMGLKHVPHLLPSAVDKLMRYDWPGNVRELENIVERAIIVSVDKEYIFPDFLEVRSPITPVISDETKEGLHDVEAKHIRQVLKRVGGRINGPGGAAELLSINPGTLRGKMRKLGIPFGRNTNSRDS